MEYSYKFRLYPTATQQEQMARNFGCCRYVFNHFLAQRHEQYRENGKARNERPFCAGVVLPGLRYSPRPGHQRREEHPQRRSAPAGVDRIYGRAGHARTDTLGETM